MGGQAGQSTSQLAWHELKKNRWAMAGLYFVVFLVYLATYAPWISADVPFRLVKEGSVTHPFFAELFNRNRFPSSVDLIFNLWSFFLAPLTLLAVIVPFDGRWQKKVWGGGVLMFVLAVPFLWSQLDDLQKPWLNYIEKSYQTEGTFFPINPMGTNPNETSDTTQPPGHRDQWGRTFYLGTDNKMRDVSAMLIYGTRISLTVGLVAVGLYILIGVILGSLAGFFGGWVDNVISRLIEAMITFPTLILIVALVAFLPKDGRIFFIMLVIGLTGWPNVARLVRAEFFRLRTQDFVIAATALGTRNVRIIFRHVLPNALGPVLVSAALGVPTAIITEGGLSFLGLGDESSSSWGQLLLAGRDTNLVNWLVHPPGIAIFLTVTAMNLLGDGLRDALDPKLRGR